MKKSALRDFLTGVVAIVMGMAFVTGCGNAATTTIDNEQVALEAEPQQAYFTKGVYVNYSADLEDPDKTYFYVFDDDGTGHIEDGNTNTGMFFEYEQVGNTVKFFFGSEEPLEDTFTVKSFENGFVRGSYEGCLDLIFEPVPDADPDTFDAVNYVNAANGEDFVYTDANGWRVRYDPDRFVIN